MARLKGEAPADPGLTALLTAELTGAVPGAVRSFAARLAARADGATAAVLFYGSGLRDAALDGLLDFYVLVDRARAWPGSRLAAAAQRVLPPNVGYVEEAIDGRVLRAKYAVMTLAQFRRRMRARSLDTTLWTRFSQPCACAFVRSDADFAAVRDCIAASVTTAAYWAAVLGPEEAPAATFWNALFAETYRLELRVESAERADTLVGRAPDRYAQALETGWRAGGIAFERRGDALRPQLDPEARAAALRRWGVRRRLGRPLNVLRLLKAALTFERALDYVVWKVERHSGVRLPVAEWERRYPLLAAPGIYRRLRRRGLLR